MSDWKMKRPASTTVRLATPKALSRQVYFRAHRIGAGTFIDEHSHSCWQFAFARSGVMHVHVAEGTQVLPPQYGMWIPANMQHSILTIGDVELESLYIEDSGGLGLVERCCTVVVTDLVREFIHYACVAMSEAGDRSRSDGLKVQVLLDLLMELPEAALRLPMPADEQMARMCNVIQEQPESRHTLDQWAAELNMTTRTFSRKFQYETGMSFLAWIQHLRLLKSLGMLKAGHSVNRIALDLGYSSSSAYIYAFRKLFGCSPMRFALGERRHSA